MSDLLWNEFDEFRKKIEGDLLVLRTALKAAIPHLSNAARIAVDRDLRKLGESIPQDDPNVDWIRLQLGPLELDALLPIHRPDWNGIPDPPAT